MSSHDDDDDGRGHGHLLADASGVRAVDCRKMVDLLGDYVDDQLPVEVKSAMDGHISLCAPCLAFLKQYRFAPEQARKALLDKVPSDLENKLLSFLRDRCKK